MEYIFQGKDIVGFEAISCFYDNFGYICENTGELVIG